MSLILGIQGRIEAVKDPTAIRRFLNKAAAESEKVFKAGLKGGHSGVKYSDLPRRSSAPGEYPAHQFGGLLGSIDSVVKSDGFEIGSNQFYSKFLREGTSKMRRRKMSDNALQEGVPKARSLLKGWIKWKRR